jgi:hypothetical protein
VRSWLPGWKTAYTALPAEQAPARLHPHRLNYYLRAIEYMLAGEQTYQAALWPLLRTWTSLIQLMPGQVELGEAWSTALQELRLLGTGFSERLEALDAYLDTVEETLDTWAAEAGA